MTTHELLEMVTLDALGLLDEREREEFDRAFAAAAPAVQAQIRREQARLAKSEMFLPAVEPPPGLRARVVAAVREAMQAVAGRSAVAGRIVPEILRPRGVSPAWRAAAIGCCAASIVFALTTLHMRAQFEEIGDVAKDNIRSDLFVQEWGTRFRSTFFAKDTQFVKFEAQPGAVSATGQPQAVLMLEGEGASTGQLLLQNLPAASGEYTLNVVDKDGKVVGDAVVTFRYTDTTQRIKGLNLKDGQSLAIVAPGGSADRPAAILKSLRS